MSTASLEAHQRAAGQQESAHHQEGAPAARLQKESARPRVPGLRLLLQGELPPSRVPPARPQAPVKSRRKNRSNFSSIQIRVYYPRVDDVTLETGEAIEHLRIQFKQKPLPSLELSRIIHLSRFS